MGDAIIVFDGVWKKFRRGERHDSLRDLVPATVRALGRRRASDALGAQEFWAVQDVSFQVRRGEALGIIGPNGAGKSTSLKLLTRILKPTRGHCHIDGRTGALIEVAAGFHPDLTGRENVYLQGAIMGMKRQEIGRRFDEIVEFAGVADFIDTPVKRYSSGMNARLGFSIAAHLAPDALVIDEVLSVGDAAFQERCVGRMKEFKRQGVAIAFVSHNLQAVTDLCDQALYLHGGVQAAGATADVLGAYLTATAARTRHNTGSTVSIANTRLTHLDGSDVSAVSAGTPIVLQSTWTTRADVSDYQISLLVYRSTDGLLVYDGYTTGQALGVPTLPAGTSMPVQLRFTTHLTRGHYYVATHMYHEPTQECLARAKPAAHFAVDERRTHSGVADLGLQASVGPRETER